MSVTVMSVCQQILRASDGQNGPTSFLAAEDPTKHRPARLGASPRAMGMGFERFERWDCPKASFRDFKRFSEILRVQKGSCVCMCNWTGEVSVLISEHNSCLSTRFFMDQKSRCSA